LHSVLRVVTEKPWRLEAVLQLLVTIVACVLLGSLAAALLRSQAGGAGRTAGALGLVIAALSFQGAAIPLIWLFVRQHGITLREGFGLGQRPGHAMLLGATVALAFIPVALALQFGTSMLAKLFHIDLPVQDVVTILNLADSWTDRIALGVVAIVLAPLAEEGLFRGIFYPALKRYGFPQAALWGTSLVFAAIHGRALIFIPLVVLAIVLVKLYEKTGNLLACVACHAAFNAFNFTMLFLFNEYSPTLPAQP
jgi:membrane protease YdiL (CAAX protease family)